ncbi:DinB family protein [Limnochorda pilosa]|uniref:DinB family protein n=1 Tax=Limnochorda pilosa TaxID=1555112 RepID=UPI00118744B6
MGPGAGWTGAHGACLPCCASDRHRPAPGRHSIWDIVRHMIFWREYALARLRNEPTPRQRTGRSRPRQAKAPGRPSWCGIGTCTCS